MGTLISVQIRFFCFCSFKSTTYQPLVKIWVLLPQMGMEATTRGQGSHSSLLSLSLPFIFEFFKNYYSLAEPFPRCQATLSKGTALRASHGETNVDQGGVCFRFLWKMKEINEEGEPSSQTSANSSRSTSVMFWITRPVPSGNSSQLVRRFQKCRCSYDERRKQNGDPHIGRKSGFLCSCLFKKVQLLFEKKKD